MALALTLGLTAAAMTLSGTVLTWDGRMTQGDIAISGIFSLATLLLVELPFVLYATRVRTRWGTAVGAVGLAGCLAWAGLSSWHVASGESPLTILSLWFTAIMEVWAFAMALFTDWLVGKQTMRSGSGPREAGVMGAASGSPQAPAAPRRLKAPSGPVLGASRRAAGIGGIVGLVFGFAAVLVVYTIVAIGSPTIDAREVALATAFIGLGIAPVAATLGAIMGWLLVRRRTRRAERPHAAPPRPDLYGSGQVL